MIAKPPLIAAHTAKFDGYTVGTRKVRYICSHITDPPVAPGALGDHMSLSCLTTGDPSDGTHCGQASANYLIARNGTIYEIVPPDHAAWAMGISNNPNTKNPIIADLMNLGINPNMWGVSIEHEGLSLKNHGVDTMTPAQWFATKALQAWLCQEYHLVPSATTLFGHDQIDSVNRSGCPGWSDAQWTALRRDVAMLLATPGGPNDPVTRALTRWYTALPTDLQGDLGNANYFEVDIDWSGLYPPPIPATARGIRGEYVAGWYWAIHEQVYPIRPEDRVKLEAATKFTRRA